MSSSPHNQALHAASTMRERIAAFDWSATPLGPREQWPASLRFAVSLCDHSSMPIALYWGPDLRLIYNDAWLPVAGDRHPAALGEKAEIVWADIWPLIGPQFRQVMESGEGLSALEAPVPITRNGLPRETYWNYSLSPLFDEQGAVAGILSQGTDVTHSVLADRRLSYQVMLADALRSCSSPQSVKDIAARALGEALHAARVGYSEVDPATATFSVRSDWTRDPSVPSLAGVTREMKTFGSRTNSWLLSGRTLVTDDVEALAESDPTHVAALRGIGARAALVIPLIRGGSIRAILYVHNAEPREWDASEVAMARDTAERTWDAVQRAQSEQSLRDSEDHYRHAVELNPQVSWTARPDGLLNRVSARWEEWTGGTGLGETWLDAIDAADRNRASEAWRRSVQTGEPLDIEHRLIRPDGTRCWVRTRAFPRYAGSGGICLWYGTTEDIQERHQAEEHQRLLINELNHRVKNTLATVQAIAYQTLKGDIPLAEARSRFEARLLALSRAHNLLTEENWEGAPIWRVILDSVAHLSEEKGRFCLDGAPLWLAPRAALALALACHELSTNAVKYGALSSDKGHVDVRWWQEGDMLRIDWKEKDGPPVAPPAGRGFGSRLIERGLAGDLEGRAHLDFEPDGLHCVIQAPLAAVLSREGERKA